MLSFRFVFLLVFLISSNAVASEEAVISLTDGVSQSTEDVASEKGEKGGFWEWLGFEKYGHEAEKKFTIGEAINLAQKGNIDAQIFLGYSFLYGVNNVEQNYAEAFKYYNMAAAQQNHIGMNNLGSMYYSGLGTKRDINKAVQLFKMASKAGNIEASTNLGFVLISSSLEKNKQNAMPYFEIAAQGGDVISKFMLGYSYYVGKYSPKDYQKAASLIKEAADAGLDEAQETMAEIYMNGTGVPQNYSSAVLYLRKSASQGRVASMVNLANILLDGKKYTQDIRSAHIYYNLASVRGNDYAAEKRNAIEAKMKINEVLDAQSAAASYKENPSSLTVYVRQTYGSDIRSYIK